MGLILQVFSSLRLILPIFAFHIHGFPKVDEQTEVNAGGDEVIH
jgi:hypothetical protein